MEVSIEEALPASTTSSTMACSTPRSSSVFSDFSSPLSTLSQSPSPPSSPILASYSSQTQKQNLSQRYPSPVSSASSGTQTPVKPKMGRVRPRSDKSDDGPPKKKARVLAAPKERTTEYLNLMKPENDVTPFDEEQRQRLVSALKKKKKIVVIAGAGISVSANIPDFRSSAGLFAPAGSQKQNLKASGKHLFDASVYKRDELTEEFHTMVREISRLADDAQPTPFHHFLASLAQEGRLLRLYSQNIDCLDTSMPPLATNVPLRSKGPWPKTIQLHGGLEKMVCTKCNKLQPLNRELFVGPEAPLCNICKEDDEVRTLHAGRRSHGIGRLRPRFVLYNEFNPDGEAIGSVCTADLKTRPDAVLVVGTSLKVPGTRRLVKELCQVTRGRRDGFTAWINIDPEPKGAEFKDCWDLVVQAKCDTVAREVNLLPWNFTIGDDYTPTLEDEKNRVASKVEVQVVSKPAMLTPFPSPKLSAADKPAKKKQSTLPFAKKPTTGDDKITKPKATATKATVKPSTRARKPLPVSQPKKVTDAFKTGKSASRTTGKNKTSAQKGAVLNIPPAKADITLVTTTLLVQDTGKSIDVSCGSETISPKSVPQSMHNIIDVQ